MKGQRTLTNQFLAQAQTGKNDFWRYLATILITGWISIGVQFIFAVPALIYYGADVLEKIPPLGMLLLAMVPFPFALLAVWGGLRWLHHRPLISVINPFGRIAWRRVFISMAIWGLLCGLSDLILALLKPGNYQWTFELARFLPYFLVGLILIPIQTSTEEIIFRGYLTQWIGRYGKGIGLPLVIPSIFFMLLHGLNSEVSAYGILLTMPFYLGFGLLLGWLTLRSEGLEIALGLHAANNFYSALVVTFPSSSLPSPALFTIQEYDPLVGLIVFLAMAVIVILVLRVFYPQWFRKSLVDGSDIQASASS